MSGRLTVLYIDDNPIDRDLVRESLQTDKSEFDLIEVSDRQQFEFILEQKKIDAILTDLYIPNYDGLEITKFVHSRHPDIPIIMLTRTGSEEIAVEAMKLGVSDYIVKNDIYIRRLPVAIYKAIASRNLYREREGAIQQIEEAKNRWERTFDALSDSLFVTDMNQRIKQANKAALRWSGSSLEDIVTKPCEKIFGKNLCANCRFCLPNKMLSHHKPLSFETDQLAPGKFFQVTVSPILNEHDELVEVVHVAKDITEQKNLTAQLIQAQKMEAIGTLAGGVGHDFNNALSAINGYLDLAMLQLEPTLPVCEDLQEVKKASLRAAGIVRQLLLFSRKKPMQTSIINLNDSIEDLLKMLDRFIGEDITLATDLATDLWNIEGDLSSLDQVSMNLTVNARDAMPNGGNVVIKTENMQLDEDFCRLNQEARPGNFVRLSISDTGTGIDNATQQRIFEPFFTTKEAGRGTGLGLAVSFGVVKNHHGWITVYSEPEQGSTFNVYLPALQQETAEISKVEADVTLNNLDGKGERILLVEDEEAIRRFVTKALERNGYTVFAAANTDEAEEIFIREKGEFELVFSDVVLTGKSGLELMDKLFESRPDLSVLLCSGYADEKSQWPVIKEQGFSFIAKPFMLNDMLLAVRNAIKK